MMANVEDKRNFLRKAGDAVGQFFVDRDREYADLVRSHQGEGTLGADLAGTPIFGGIEIRSREEMDKDFDSPLNNLEFAINRAGELAYTAGTLGTNAGYRYGLPAAGVTLAGKGLYDLTAGMNEQTSGTIMP
jgi:hypothetical protein